MAPSQIYSRKVSGQGISIYVKPVSRYIIYLVNPNTLLVSGCNVWLVRGDWVNDSSFLVSRYVVDRAYHFGKHLDIGFGILNCRFSSAPGTVTKDQEAFRLWRTPVRLHDFEMNRIRYMP